MRDMHTYEAANLFASLVSYARIHLLLTAGE